MYRFLSVGSIPSIIWSMRAVPSVVMFSTWVSPRSNSPDPWAVSTTPTSEPSGRRPVAPRPSIRMPSLTIRPRTMLLVSERTAAEICLSAPSISPNRSESDARISSLACDSASCRSALSAIDMAADSFAAPTSATAASTSGL